MQEFGGYGVLLVALLAVLSSATSTSSFNNELYNCQRIKKNVSKSESLRGIRPDGWKCSDDKGECSGNIIDKFSASNYTRREIVSKYACLGDTTEMFEDITFDSGIEDVRLYRNGLWSSTIAMWHKQNDTFISSIVPEYKQRVFLDEYGSIWIRNIHLSDEGKYFIKQVIYSSLMTTEIHIYVLVPPNNHCRPKIMHLDNVLTVYLDFQDCGSPVPHVRWLDHPGISHASNSLAKLRPGNEAGTYYACSEGPALRCLKTSTALDLCTAFTIAGSNSPPESLDIPDKMTVITLLVVLIALILVMVITASVVAIIRKRNVRKYRAATSILRKRMERPGSVKAALNVPPSYFKENLL